MDYAHEQADKELKKLEKKIEKEYRKAYKEVKKKADAYLAQFKKEDADKKKLVKAKLMSQEDYIAWREKAMLSGKRWSDMADVLAQDLVNADKIAASLIRDQLPDIYALNANYGAYEIENGLGINTSWTMYDHRTVENLMRKDPQVVPMPKMDIPKDLRWNRQKIHSAITQGVLQGDSIPHIAQRLRGVTNMDRVAAIRNARTYTTAAENKGRIDSYKYAQDLGIELQKEWMSTPDGRTRDSHVDLDGERVEIDGTFSNGCRYPADPMGEPAEVYNCRCTLVAAVKGRQYHDNRFTRLPDGMTYEDWKNHKLKENEEGSEALIGATGNRYTQEQRTELQKKLNAAPDDIKNIWKTHQDSFKETESPRAEDSNSSAYFSRDTGTVYLDPEQVANDTIPYETHFHEYGHNIDWLAGGNGKDDYLTTVWRDEGGRSFEQIIMNEWGKKFGVTPEEVNMYYFDINLDRTKGGTGAYLYVRNELNLWRRLNNIGRRDEPFLSLKNELDSIENDDAKIREFFKRNIGIFTRKDEFAGDIGRFETIKLKEYCDKIKDEYSISARGDLSDMLERYSVTHGGQEYPLGVGHGEWYAKYEGTLGKEAFAEMFSASVTNKESLELIQRELPESYEAFKKMTRGMVGK